VDKLITHVGMNGRGKKIALCLNTVLFPIIADFVIIQCHVGRHPAHKFLKMRLIKYFPVPGEKLIGLIVRRYEI